MTSTRSCCQGWSHEVEVSSQGERIENEEKAAGPKPDKCLHSRGREEKEGKMVKRNAGKEGVCNGKINYGRRLQGKKSSKLNG